MDNFNQGYNLNGGNQFGYNQNNQFGYQNNQFGNQNNQFGNQNNGYNYNQNAVGKSKVITLLLCMFLGVLGIHRFYMGKIGTGILYLLTCGLFGFGVIIDFIRICNGSLRDKKGRDFEKDITDVGSSRLLKFMIAYYLIVIILSIAIGVIFGVSAVALGQAVENNVNQSMVFEVDKEPISKDVFYDVEVLPEESNNISVNENIEIDTNEEIDTIVKDTDTHMGTLSFLTSTSINENPNDWIEVSYDFSKYPQWNTGIYTGKVELYADDTYYSNIEVALQENELSDLMTYDDFYVDYYKEEGIMELYSIDIDNLIVDSIDAKNGIVYLIPLSDATNPLTVKCVLFEGTSISTDDGIKIGDEVSMRGHIEKDVTKDNFIVYTLSMYDYN